MKSFKVPLNESEVVLLTVGTIREAASTICNNINGCKFREFANIGTGSVNLIEFDSGIIIVLWDGNRHVDINIFTFFERISFHEDIVNFFLKKLPSMQISLKDTHPRGTGHVVNFAADLKSHDNPIWA